LPNSAKRHVKLIVFIVELLFYTPAIEVASRLLV